MESSEIRNEKLPGFYKWALFYREQLGAAVIPLREGKIPLVQWSQFQKQQPTINHYMEWFVNNQPWGIAIVCGRVSGNLIRLDFDDPADYKKLKHALPKGTPIFKSQRHSGGYGAILRSSIPVPKLPEGTFECFPKLGINGEGSITVVPPTPGYEWLAKPVTVPVIDGHSWIRDNLGYEITGKHTRLAELAGLGSSSDKQAEKITAFIVNTKQGSRNNAILRLAEYLKWHRVPVEVALPFLRCVADSWRGDVLNDSELEQTVRSAYKYEGLMENPKEQATNVKQRKNHRVGSFV
ncbi:bifunctional DNA primase/polymerase [Chloroflexota bacterium]